MLIKVLYLLFEQSFTANFHCFFSFVHIQGDPLQCHGQLLDNVAHTGHRNIKISENRFVPLRLSVLFYNFGSQILRQLYTLLSLLHALCNTHRHTTQRMSQLFSTLTSSKCDFYIANTCELLQVSLITN